MKEMKLTIPVILANDVDIIQTLYLFTSIKQEVSVACFNEGKKPLNAVQLQKQVYQAIKGKVSSQLTITAMRCVAGAYASAWKQRKSKELKKAFCFKKETAVYLIGQRGRDADFRKDGTLSIWTPVGRKHIAYSIPEHYKTLFETAKEYDRMTIIERDGQLVGKLCCTIEVPETTGIHPIGIDLNQTNTLVATDADNKTLFISGRTIKQKNIQNRKTRSRLQKKLAQHKADKCSTRSIRRTLKRLGKRISNRNRTFSQQVAKTVCEWAKPNSIFIFEELTGIKKKKKYTDRKGNIRKSNEWNHRQIRMAIEHKAQFYGHVISHVNPAYTSQICSKCGILGTRRKHAFSCICGHLDHADINASKNIRNRYTILRSSGVQSITPEALIRNDVGQATTL